MTTRDTLSARIVKNGLCAVMTALLLSVALAMAGTLIQQGVANFVVHAQSVDGITFK